MMKIRFGRVDFARLPCAQTTWQSAMSAGTTTDIAMVFPPQSSPETATSRRAPWMHPGAELKAIAKKLAAWFFGCERGGVE